MSFDKLLEDIQSLNAEHEILSKALPADDGKDDDKIQAAAEEGGDGEDGDEDGDEGDDDGEPMGKALGTVTLPDGQKVEAIDGTELVKSLMARLDAGEGQMHKALEGALGLIKSQGAMIKSLSDQVNKLSNAGRGRKAVVTVTEKKPAGGDTLAKSESGMSPQEFMAKSNAAWQAGKISGLELTRIDVTLRQGAQVDPTLVAKVIS